MNLLDARVKNSASRSVRKREIESESSANEVGGWSAVGDVVFHYPYRICHDDDFMYVADGTNNRVLIIS